MRQSHITSRHCLPKVEFYGFTVSKTRNVCQKNGTLYKKILYALNQSPVSITFQTRHKLFSRLSQRFVNSLTTVHFLLFPGFPHKSQADTRNSSIRKSSVGEQKFLTQLQQIWQLRIEKTSSPSTKRWKLKTAKPR